MLKAKLNGHYRKEQGRIVFRHIVTGTKEELAAYKEAQDQYYREDDDGNPLFFSPRYIADQFELTITTNGKVVANDLDAVIEQQLEEEKAVRTELAKLVAKEQFERRRSGRRTFVNDEEKQPAGEAEL